MSQGVWCSPGLIVHVYIGPNSGHSRASLSLYRHAVYRKPSGMLEARHTTQGYIHSTHTHSHGPLGHAHAHTPLHPPHLQSHTQTRLSILYCCVHLYTRLIFLVHVLSRMLRVNVCMLRANSHMLRVNARIPTWSSRR